MRGKRDMIPAYQPARILNPSPSHPVHMFEVEAVRLREILLAAGDVSPLLNLGSSTQAFRELEKPHIERELFAPLRAAGIQVVHCDLKSDQGVDIAGNVLDPDVRARLAQQGFRCVLLSNLLEHVVDRAAVTHACEDIVGPGGVILASVPASFPYHADPIDTGYRPSPGRLAADFTRSRILAAEELEGPNYRDQMRQRGKVPWLELARTLLWVLIAPLRPKSAIARVSRWRWYHRPYRVSIALLRVDGDLVASRES